MKFHKISQEHYNKLLQILENYKKLVYEYNKEISGKGYYLKPKHIIVKRTRYGKVKYIYFGRYWYKIVYVGKKNKSSKIKWIYLGREKPDPKLPDPPHHPLENIVIKIDEHGIYINETGEAI